MIFLSSPLNVNVQKISVGAFATSQIMKPTVRIISSQAYSSREVSAYQIFSCNNGHV